MAAEQRNPYPPRLPAKPRGPRCLRAASPAHARLGACVLPGAVSPSKSVRRCRRLLLSCLGWGKGNGRTIRMSTGDWPT
ncbi:hypothetical protein E2562_001080 [Oryza meyeriana var. granulata]|uniref:Uncharacterized protein n=1 Tax=Oryza meyeriana var. granulata TaxID=110450 RepID=A0A6G1EFG3_9ORYZ|nr:hypothetical protein E2562_001080 [Oryza meyeriana var. granulata]